MRDNEDNYQNILYEVFLVWFTLFLFKHLLPHLEYYANRLRTNTINLSFNPGVILTSDSESSRGLAVSGHKGHFSRVICLAIPNCECVLSEHAGNGNTGIFLQLLAIAGPVDIGEGMLQLHTEDDSVTDRNYCPPGKLLSNVAWDIRGLHKGTHLNKA